MLFSLRTILFTLGFIVVLSCNKSKPKRAFYYWKTNFALGVAERNYLKETKTEKLYIRFFDVIVGPDGHAKPEAPVIFSDSLPMNMEIVPVVYIRNEVFKSIKANNIDSLALKIISLVTQIAFSKNIYLNELQLDCDWSGTTQKFYFSFLKSIKQHSKSSIVSATIRLHQIKFKEQTGVPPVDRGMLMYYNMGTISLNNSTNSIFDVQTARQYSDYISTYSLPLDLALPIFQWAIHGGPDRKVKGLIENFSTDEISDTSHFILHDKDLYLVTNSFLLHGTYLKKNDFLKFEPVTFNLTQQAASQVAGEFKTLPGCISLFALDSTNLCNFTLDEIEQIYDSF